jgi:serine protease Do
MIRTMRLSLSKTAAPKIARFGISILTAGMFFAILCAPGARASEANLEGSLSRLYRQVSPAVVKVVSHRVGPGTTFGNASCRQLVASGVVVGEAGAIVTTDRVAQPGDSLMVYFPDGRQARADYAGSHAYLHIAVLRLREPGPYPRLQRGAPGAPMPDWVAAIAYGPWEGPKPGYPSLSLSQRGAIEPMQVRCGDSLGTVWRVRAPFYPGNGGGALVSLSGEWIGLITGAVAVQGPLPGTAGGDRTSWDEGVIVPADLVARAVEVIEAGPTLCTQGFLGVLATRRAAIGDTTSAGIRVSDVIAGSPADRCGLMAGDILVRFDSTPVRDAAELTRLICAMPPGRTVRVDVLRKGVGRTLEVSLGDRATGERDLAQMRDRVAGESALRREITDLEKRLRLLQRQLEENHAAGQAAQPVRSGSSSN